jgi:hypothetical protein
MASEPGKGSTFAVLLSALPSRISNPPPVG